MTGFSADWLTLREPYDRAARNPAVLAAVGAAFVHLPSINVVDLACGTGSTVRALAQMLPARQNWRLFDNDLSLLARAASETQAVATPLDLAHDLEVALDGAVDLVTTSALLDLVSGEWLERLAIEAAARRLPVYAALTYNGRVEIMPSDRLDAAIVQAVNTHQRGDKGFGPALGPTAAQSVVSCFERVGYTVAQGVSDWVFGVDDQAIQNETLAGWAVAARQVGSVSVSDVERWLERRVALIASGQSTIRVGHIDVFATLPPLEN